MSFGRLSRPKAQTSALAPMKAPMSQINVTPLVDVMLVLLVIFMLTAPLLTSALKLDLPRAAAPAAAAPAASLRLEIDKSGQAFLQGQALDAAQLAQRLAQAAAAQPDTELQLHADQAVPYGRVVELIAVAQQAGLSRIGFVAEAAPFPSLSSSRARP
jgi:biopolymer transport protein TolR